MLPLRESQIRQLVGNKVKKSTLFYLQGYPVPTTKFPSTADCTDMWDHEIRRKKNIFVMALLFITSP